MKKVMSECLRHVLIFYDVNFIILLQPYKSSGPLHGWYAGTINTVTSVFCSVLLGQ